MHGKFKSAHGISLGRSKCSYVEKRFNGQAVHQRQARARDAQGIYSARLTISAVKNYIYHEWKIDQKKRYRRREKTSDNRIAYQAN